ncbi:MAG: hypothetical protein ACR2NZ_12660 [Rubripirellula sp.]
MRTSAFTASVFALATLANSVSANDDFSALLADLSFGDAPTLEEPLAQVQEIKVAELKPVPTGFSMPEMVEGTPPAQVVSAKPPAAPQVALQDPIPESKPTPQIDLEAAFALQDPGFTEPSLQAQTVGFGQSSCLGDSCDHGVVCRPHMRPNLPTSTFLQYFRSHPCYSNVWDGYRYECGPHHKHLHGECNCLNGSCTGHGNCDSGCDR